MQGKSERFPFTLTRADIEWLKENLPNPSEFLRAAAREKLERELGTLPPNHLRVPKRGRQFKHPQPQN
jgi:hypothetical protein